jgi:hypothetical protein
MDRADKILLVFLAANAELVQVPIVLAPALLSQHGSVPAPVDAGALRNFVLRGGPCGSTDVSPGNDADPSSSTCHLAGPSMKESG